MTVTAAGRRSLDTAVDSRSAPRVTVPTTFEIDARPVAPLSESGRSTTSAWDECAGDEETFFGPHAAVQAATNVARAASERARIIVRLGLHTNRE
jgi:hypothetical protein